MRFLALLTLALFTVPALPTAAQAQDFNTLLDIPEGATLVNISATEQVEIEQDLLIANLRYETEDASAKTVQDKINTLMQKALDEAKKVPSVKASTQQYSVYQYDRSRGEGARRDMVWRGQQGLMIKGKTADELLELTGKLQDMGLAMNGLSYTVSPELMEETRNSLLEAALTKLQTQAERTAKAIGKTQTELLQIDVNSGGGYNPPMMRAMAMDSRAEKMEMAPPVAAPGETTVNLTVSAQALLR